MGGKFMMSGSMWGSSRAAMGNPSSPCPKKSALAAVQLSVVKFFWTPEEIKDFKAKKIDEIEKHLKKLQESKDEKILPVTQACKVRFEDLKQQMDRMSVEFPMSKKSPVDAKFQITEGIAQLHVKQIDVLDNYFKDGMEKEHKSIPGVNTTPAQVLKCVFAFFRNHEVFAVLQVCKQLNATGKERLGKDLYPVSKKIPNQGLKPNFSGIPKQKLDGARFVYIDKYKAVLDLNYASSKVIADTLYKAKPIPEVLHRFAINRAKALAEHEKQMLKEGTDTRQEQSEPLKLVA